MVDISEDYGQAGASGHESHSDDGIKQVFLDLADDLEAAGAPAPAYLTGLEATDIAAATGSITFPAQEELEDGETFTLVDADGTSVTFEFDVTGTNTPTGDNVEIDISGDTTAAEVAATAATAINAATIDIEAGTPDGGLLPLTQQIAGSSGNTAIVFDVESEDFIPETFTGGTDAAIVLDQQGYVLQVQATTASSTGPKVVRSTGAPSAGQVLLEYENGVPTLTFNLADAVTVASVLQIRRPAGYTGQLHRAI